MSLKFFRIDHECFDSDEIKALETIALTEYPDIPIMHKAPEFKKGMQGINYITKADIHIDDVIISDVPFAINVESLEVLFDIDNLVNVTSQTGINTNFRYVCIGTNDLCKSLFWKPAARSKIARSAYRLLRYCFSREEIAIGGGITPKLADNYKKMLGALIVGTRMFFVDIRENTIDNVKKALQTEIDVMYRLGAMLGRSYTERISELQTRIEN